MALSEGRGRCAVLSFARRRPSFSWAEEESQRCHELPGGVGNEFADHVPQAGDGPCG